ncbi:amine oxidase [Plakobranchus ocellatus]|uniref:Amine oxidase n=1 Tax=Plakobranchus ocellatus TaxID=259542 RepID=A0AAV4BI58_9GAST|nr:amine oxidase [Plakobranchus ocellatus]
MQSVLDKHNIVKQAFHGGHFIGNHCHKYLNNEIYKQLTLEIIHTVGRNTQQDSVIAKAFEMESKHNDINDNYRDVHLVLSHARPVTEQEIEGADLAIKKYMNNYRVRFPNSISPKHHILERHCIEWMRRYKFGMAFHGEQGGEMLHSTIAKTERRAAGLRQEKQKMACIMETSVLQTASDIQSLVPKPKRKRK